MRRLLPEEELRLLAKVGKLYYEEGFNQDEIVKRLHLSRSKVSRLLQQARAEGIVKITVIPPPGIYADLEVELESRFRLQEAIVVDGQQPYNLKTVARELGAAAAGYLQRTIQPGDVIGVSWGHTMNEMVAAMQPSNIENVQVVQMIGGLGKPESEVHATDLCRRLARLLGGRLVLLPAPGIVDQQPFKEILLSDSHIQSAFRLFPKISTAYVGIGAPAPDTVLMRDASIIHPEELAGLLAQGAVGDIALRFFDAFGQPVHSELDERVIGISLQELKKIDRVVGVAGGPDKEAAIYGALRGGLIDVLVTDHITAARLVEDVPSFSKRG